MSCHAYIALAEINNIFAAGTVNVLHLAATAMDATASTAATTWKMKAPANLLWRPFLRGIPMLSAPRFKPEQA